MTATISKLTGQALIDHVTNGEINGLTKTEQCLTAGYVRDNGKPAYTEFYEQLLEAKGIINQEIEEDDDEEWYGSMTEQQQELYDAIEDSCPEFTKLSTEDCDTFMEELSDIGIETAEQFNDAYCGQHDGWNPEKEFSEELMNELGYVNEDSPVYFAIDWQRVWNHSLSYDYNTISFDGATYFFRNN